MLKRISDIRIISMQGNRTKRKIIQVYFLRKLNKQENNLSIFSQDILFGIKPNLTNFSTHLNKQFLQVSKKWDK